MLIKNWKMIYGENILPCTAPCSMYSVLFENGKISDPFFGENELSLRELSDSDTVFTADFEVSASDLSREYSELIFYGLDTICDIYLNGHLIAKTENMHRTYEFDVKSLLKEKNTLKLYFHSPTRYFREMNNKHYLYMNGDTWAGASHLRKAYYMSGWDWAPMLSDMGIFRNVELISYDTDKFTDIEIRQTHENGDVTLSLSAETKYGTELTVTVEIDGDTVELSRGKGQYKVKNPKLWWPNGYGEQYLYDIKFNLKKDGEIIDTVTKTVGLRTLTLSTEQLSDGSEFSFVVNGVKIFAMGANYVPTDSLTARITPERLKTVIDACVFANFNCVRVWGGAYYPEDEFYGMCDRAGLIVWQDFMVACANVWLRPKFKEEIIAEAICNIKRLRHHASLGLLCGNNEMESAVKGWGGVGDSMLVKLDYLELYERIFPELCEKYAPDTFYLPSSPTSGGGFDDPDAKHRGDVHYWDVWHSSKPFTDYRNHKFRFCSEYGFESFPSIKTVKSFTEENDRDRNIFSRVMENHQKCKGGNTKILTYLANTYPYPNGLENLVYASQLVQGSAIKFGVEHFRRIRGYCMGSIYWQLNDCWPVASWSSIDYYGRYKALHYFAKKFYAPTAVGIFIESGRIIVNLANERREAFCGKIKSYIMKNDFTEIQSEEKEVTADALSSLDVASYDASLINGKFDTYFAVELYDENGCLIMRNCELGVLPKQYDFIKPNIKVTAENKDGGVLLSFNSDVFAKNVEVDFKNHDITLSDNYFDITNKDVYSVFADTKLSADELISELTLRTVYDIPMIK